MSNNPFDVIVEEIRSFRAEIRSRASASSDRIERKLKAEPPELGPKQSYSVTEAAALLGKSNFTVREWCRLGRINARSGDYRRGGGTIWIIPAEEIDRYLADDLLPLDPSRNRGR